MGRYADSLLTEGEQIVLRSRQHWLALAAKARAGIVMFVVGILLLIAIPLFKIQKGLLPDLISVLALVLIIVGLLIFLYRAWHWWAQDYVITNRRLLKVTGVLNKRSGDSSLEKINDAILTQSIWGRMFNFGNLEILTAADQAVDRYYMLNDPKDFKKTMLTQKHNLETEFMYGRPPSPPLRASTDMPAAPVMPPDNGPALYEPPATPAVEYPPVVAAAAAPAPHELAPPPAESVDADGESRRVTETLARLADLRDDGAITPEEYEQKKDELLGRL